MNLQFLRNRSQFRISIRIPICTKVYQLSIYKLIFQKHTNYGPASDLQPRSNYQGLPALRELLIFAGHIWNILEQLPDCSQPESILNYFLQVDIFADIYSVKGNDQSSSRR